MVRDMKLKDGINFKELEQLGFKEDKFMGYVLKGDKLNENWQSMICIISKDNKDIWIAKDKEEEVKKLLSEMYE